MSTNTRIRFSPADAELATCQWGFNCGPSALCAVLGMTPDEIRPLMGDFERKRYTNPKLMLEVLRRSGANHRMTYRSDEPGKPLPQLRNGLVRIQWSGPWTNPGVPVMARYRMTHWIAIQAGCALDVFDVNAIRFGGWIERETWEARLVPFLLTFLLKECVPGADGGWWPTHGIEVESLAPRAAPVGGRQPDAVSWIAVSDGRPMHYQKVIVHRAGCYEAAVVDHWIDIDGSSVWGFGPDHLVAGPTHWMPIPGVSS